MIRRQINISSSLSALGKYSSLFIDSFTYKFDLLLGIFWYNLVYIGFSYARREFLRKIFYQNIAIIAIQHSKMHFVDTFGDFSHTVE